MDPLHGLGNRIVIRDVQLNRGQLTRVLLELALEFIEAGLVQIQGGNARALFQEALHQAAPDAAGCASDDGDFVFESTHRNALL
ncbi:hypothetical protein D3C72_1660430 [compost metagenome]